MLLNCGVGEDSWESLGLQGDPTSPFWRRSVLGFLCKEWFWSWNSSTLATSCQELTHWKRLWCWEGLGAGGEGDDRGWDGWMASPTQWTWVWVRSASCDGQGGLVCCSPCGCKEADTTERLNWLTVISLFRVLFILESVLVICVFLGIGPFHLNFLIYWYTADHSISFDFCRVRNDSSFIPNFSNESSLFVSWPVWHLSMLFIFSKNFLFCWFLSVIFLFFVVHSFLL